jgi:hypothetical protein
MEKIDWIEKDDTSNNFLHLTGVPLRSTPAGEKYDGAKINMMSLPTITTKTMGSDT